MLNDTWKLASNIEAALLCFNLKVRNKEVNRGKTLLLIYLIWKLFQMVSISDYGQHNTRGCLNTSPQCLCLLIK